MTFKIGLKILSKKEQKMTTELALNTIDSTLSIWNDNEHLQEIRKLFAPTLSDIEFKIYVGMGKATGLNPFLKEIWAIKFGKDKDGKELPAQIFIGRDGYRKGAQSHPEYDFHQSDAVYENDKFDVNNGVINHSYGLTNRGKLIGAYCMTKRKSASKPQFVFCELEEYTTGQALWAEVQWKDNKYGGKYKQGGKPATMIKKVAESQCLRLAFQDMFAGTCDEEEMQYDPNTTTVDNDTGKKLTKSEMVDKMQSSKNKPIVVNPIVENNTATVENPITQEQIEKIESLVIQTEFPPDRISKAFAHYKAQILEDFTESNANHFISILEKELDKLSKIDLSDIDPETGEIIQ